MRQRDLERLRARRNRPEEAGVQRDHDREEHGRSADVLGTRDLAALLLPDSGHLQEEDARLANRRGYSKHQPALPLYTAAEDSDGITSMTVNGQIVDVKPDAGGYVAINRTWKAGDRIEFELPMQVQRGRASEKIAADHAKVALRYGPLMYNIEQADHPDITKRLAPDAPLSTEWKPELLGGVVVALVLGALYFAQAAPVYESEAQVLVVKKRPDVLPVAGNGLGATPSEDFIPTHQGILKSALIVNDAVQKAKLHSLDSLRDTKRVTERILKRLKATRSGKAGSMTNIIDVSFRANDPQDADTVLNAVLDALVEHRRMREPKP